MKKVRKTILEELKKLQQQKLTPKEFQSVKNTVQMELLDQSFDQSPDKYAEQYSHHVLWDQPSQTFTEVYDNYQKITPKDLQQATKQYLDTHKVITVHSHK